MGGWTLSNFDQFWQAWPLKRAKKDAEKAWKAVGADNQIEAILQAVDKQRRTIWAGEKSRFIPLPATWIRGERWTDEIVVQTYEPKSSQSLIDKKMEEATKPKLHPCQQAANRLLLNFIRARHGVDPALIPALVDEKNRVARWIFKIKDDPEAIRSAPGQVAQRFAGVCDAGP